MLVQVCPKGDTSSQGKVIDHFRCYGNGTVGAFFVQSNEPNRLIFPLYLFLRWKRQLAVLKQKLVKY